jgi:Tfp pilus assembly protein PilV
VRKSYEGYLLLEMMIAMTVILFSILMMMSSINFLFLDEKKCQEELEMSILLYEMASGLNVSSDNKEIIRNKGKTSGFIIKDWNQNHLRIESEELFLEVKKE